MWKFEILIYRILGLAYVSILYISILKSFFLSNPYLLYFFNKFNDSPLIFKLIMSRFDEKCTA